MDNWERIKQIWPVGTKVSGKVTSHRPFGFFVAIDDVPFKGLVQIVDLKDNEAVSPIDYPAIGSAVKAVILGFRETGDQIWLGMKPSQMCRGFDHKASPNSELDS